VKEKYKIGDISKLLGIPIQTLHYYEKCGFVTPSKDEQNHYRYYDAWDVNFLLDSKYLRSLRFSNAEIEQMINKDSMEEIHSRFDTQEKKLLDIIYHYQAVLDELYSENRRLSSFQNHIEKFQEMKSPQLLFNRYRFNNTYNIATDQNGEMPRISSWLEHLPFVKATFIISHEGIKEKKQEELAYWWGFSVSPGRAKELQIPTEAPVQYVPSRKSVYTVFSAHEANTFIPSLYAKVLKPIWEMGYEISDFPIGRLLVRSHEEKQYTRYFEIWVPVQ